MLCIRATEFFSTRRISETASGRHKLILRLEFKKIGNYVYYRMAPVFNDLG